MSACCWRYGLVSLASLFIVWTVPAAAAPTRPPYPSSIAFFDDLHGIGSAWTDGRLIRTSDGGRHWTATGRALDVAVVPVPGSHEAWATTSGRRLVHSVDRGETWRSVPGVRADGVTFVDREAGWAWLDDYHAYATVLRTTRDGGRRCTRVRSPCGSSYYGTAFSFTSRRSGIAVCPGQPGAGSQQKAVYATGDGGQSWHLRSRTSVDPRLPSTRNGLPLGGYVRGALARPGGTVWVWEARGAAYRSADGGRSWQPLPFTHDEVEAHSIAAAGRSMWMVLWRNDRIRRIELRRSRDGGRTWPIVLTGPWR